MNPSIELDGLREALDALKKMGGTPADAKSMNKQVIDEVVDRYRSEKVLGA